MATRLRANNMTAGDPTHPGKLIMEELIAAGFSVKKAADQMKVDPAILKRIIKGKDSLNAELALKIETLLGLDASFLMRLQTGYDIAANARK